MTEYTTTETLPEDAGDDAVSADDGYRIEGTAGWPHEEPDLGEVPSASADVTWRQQAAAPFDTRTDDQVMEEASRTDPFPTLRRAVTAPDGTAARPLTRRERKRARQAFEHDLKVARAERRAAEEAAREERRSRHARLRDLTDEVARMEKEQGKRLEGQRRARRRARDVYGAVGFDRMFSDGICEVEAGLYSETLEFTDVSYQSASEESQRATFDVMASLIDYLEAPACMQWSVENVPLPKDEVGRRTFFDEVAAGPNAAIAAEFNRVLNDKVREGSSNIHRTRHVTYSVPADDPVRAAQALERLRAGVRARLSAAGSSSRVLSGAERLALISHVLRPEVPFDFDYARDLSPHSPLTAKDFVCPTALDFRPDGDAGCYQSEGTWCQVLVVRPNLAAQLSDRAISDISDLPVPMVVTWHLAQIDKVRAKQICSRQASWIQKEMIDHQRRALRQGYDTSILPPELVDLREENEHVRTRLDDLRQHLFVFCGLVLTWGQSREELKGRVLEICRTAHACGIELATLPLRQREGMNSVLPLAHNHVDVTRDLLTVEATTLMPFTTQEIDQAGGGYYGQNRLSGNLVVCDRKRLMSPHGFVCGMSGSGKSFAVKREIVNTVLANPADEVYVMDVTGEYAYLVKACHGTQVTLGPDSRSHMNPLEMAGAGDLSPAASLAWKVDALIAMCAALKSEGGTDLTQEERSVIARSAEATYRKAGDVAPTLGDLVDELGREEGAGRQEAARLALVLSRYVEGPMGFLNHPSDVTLGQSRLTNFDTSEVPSDMKVLAMLANLECVRQRMHRNHARGVYTWLYIDEVQSLFAHPAVIAYLARLWREGRKFGLVCTGMTQSAAAMSAGGEAAQIIDQSGFLLLMRQADADRAFWVRARSLSAQEEGYVSETARPGQGLLIADAARVPVTDDFPRETRLFDMFSTSPEDVARRDRERDQSRGER